MQYLMWIWKQICLTTKTGVRCRTLFFFLLARTAETLWTVSFVKIPTSKVAHVYWVHSAGARFSIRFPWREKVWSPPLILLIKWKHSGLHTVRQYRSTHAHTHARTKVPNVDLYGELHRVPASSSVVSSYAVRSHTRLTCNTLQIMSINKQGNVLPERKNINSKASHLYWEEMLPH